MEKSTVYVLGISFSFVSASMSVCVVAFHTYPNDRKTDVLACAARCLSLGVFKKPQCVLPAFKADSFV